MAAKKKKIVEKEEKENVCCSSGSCSTGSCGSAVYGLGFVGAVVYYISTASGFWVGVFGVLKALVWPAFLIYEAMKYIGM